MHQFIKKILLLLVVCILVFTACSETATNDPVYADFTVDGDSYHWDGYSHGFLYSYFGTGSWTATFLLNHDNGFAGRNKLILTIEGDDNPSPGLYDTYSTIIRYYNDFSSEFSSEETASSSTITITEWNYGIAKGSFTGVLDGSLDVEGTFTAVYTRD